MRALTSPRLVVVTYRQQLVAQAAQMWYFGACSRCMPMPLTI